MTVVRHNAEYHGKTDIQKDIRSVVVSKSSRKTLTDMIIFAERLEDKVIPWASPLKTKEPCSLLMTASCTQKIHVQKDYTFPKGSCYFVCMGASVEYGIYAQNLNKRQPCFAADQEVPSPLTIWAGWRDCLEHSLYKCEVPWHKYQKGFKLGFTYTDKVKKVNCMFHWLDSFRETYKLWAWLWRSVWRSTTSQFFFTWNISVQSGNFTFWGKWKNKTPKKNSKVYMSQTAIILPVLNKLQVFFKTQVVIITWNPLHKMPIQDAVSNGEQPCSDSGWAYICLKYIDKIKVFPDSLETIS